MVSLIRKLTLKLKIFKNKSIHWKEFEYFDQSWKLRIEEMSKFIFPNSTVMDLGCGKMWLKDYLPNNCTYIPVDYIKRSNICVVCDFNKPDFPNIDVDIIFISGCLEYINDYKKFINNISRNCVFCIISYCTINNFNIENFRKQRGWKNDLSYNEILYLFNLNNFTLIDSFDIKSKDTIFIFKINENFNY